MLRGAGQGTGMTARSNLRRNRARLKGGSVGLFTRANRQPEKTAVRPGMGKMGSGRRLRSALSPDECAEVLETLFGTYRPRIHPEQPHLVPAGIEWTAEEGKPTLALCGDDENDDFILFTLAATADGTDAGVFPLGSGDDRLSPLSVVGHWKQRDPPLSSVGTWPHATVLLGPPPIDDSLIDSTLSAAGFPATARNRFLLAEQFQIMFRLKCFEYVNGMKGEAASRLFDAAYERRRDSTTMSGPFRSLLQLLAETLPGVQPYIQDLPVRIRAMMLEMDDPAPLWSEMEQAG
jgi:hypothetical protein